jgi:hypothetical protein
VDPTRDSKNNFSLMAGNRGTEDELSEMGFN